MAGRSMATQIAQLQKEVTQGTPVTDAMMRPLSLRLVPGVNVEGGESFTAAGANAPTAYIPGDEWGTWSVDGVQDYNTLGLIAASTMGSATTTAVVGATGAYEHVFTPAAFGEDDVATYTAQFGDGTIGIQGSQFTFQQLGISVQRGTLGLTSNAISRQLDFDATLATTGVTNIPAVPIHSTKYDVYADDAWDDLGTSKLLACYQFDVTMPDKFVPDAPINSAVNGFESLIVAADRESTVSITLGLDATATDMIGSFRTGALKFFRLEVLGGTIDGTATYKFTRDLAVQITSVGEVAAQSGSNVVTVPLTGTIIIDPTSDKYEELTLVNTVASY